MSERQKPLSAVFPVILRFEGNKTSILLHRRQNTGYQDGKLDLAGGGHVEAGETGRKALVRECKEELGIDIAEDDLAFAHLSHRISSDKVYFDIYFLVNAYKGKPAIMEPHKCLELNWYNINDLPTDIIECRRQAIENYKRNIYYSEIMDI